MRRSRESRESEILNKIKNNIKKMKIFLIEIGWCVVVGCHNTFTKNRKKNINFFGGFLNIKLKSKATGAVNQKCKSLCQVSEV